MVLLGGGLIQLPGVRRGEIGLRVGVFECFLRWVLDGRPGLLLYLHGIWFGILFFPMLNLGLVDFLQCFFNVSETILFGMYAPRASEILQPSLLSGKL